MPCELIFKENCAGDSINFLDEKYKQNPETKKLTRSILDPTPLITHSHAKK